MYYIPSNLKFQEILLAGCKAYAVKRHVAAFVRKEAAIDQFSDVAALKSAAVMHIKSSFEGASIAATRSD